MIEHTQTEYSVADLSNYSDTVELQWPTSDYLRPILLFMVLHDNKGIHSI